MTGSASTTHRFVIKRFGIGSLAGWGFAIGALVVCLPSFICSLVAFQLANALHLLLDSWRDIGITIIGQRISLNFLSLLHLQRFSSAIGDLAALGIFGILLLTLIAVLVVGAFAAVVMALFGLFYNLTGRIHIELAEE